MPDLKYWATLPPDELTPKVMERVRAWRRYFNASDMASKSAKGHRYYYGHSDSGDSSSHLSVAGERRDAVRSIVNGVRPLVQRTVAMLLSGAPEMQPVAANSDAQAREQAIAAKGILEHVHREQQVDVLRRQALTAAMVMGEGFRAVLWDANEGDVTAVDPETQREAERAGDFRNAVLTPFDVYRDPGYRNWREVPWVAFRLWENRYELAATYPEKASEIVNLPSNEAMRESEGWLDVRWRADERLIESDAVPVYYFFHKDNRACPDGRALMLVSERLWLTDGPNPYGRLPVERLTPDDVLGTSLGYTNVFDALGITDVLDGLYSAATTNNVRFGVPSLITYKGSGLTVSRLASGAVSMEVNQQGMEPKALETPRTPPESFNLMDRLERVRMMSLGLNETALGTPPFSGMAASAMALLDGKAGEYMDGLAQSLRSFDAACATAEIRVLKAFANDERMAVIEGKSRNWMLKSFRGSDLASVDRIAVEPVKATSRNQAGKFALLELLGQFGVDLKPEQIIDLANTGQLESMFEHEQANVLRIKSENELLLDGQRPTVLVARTHWLDIPEHLSLLSSPAVEERPDVVEAVLATVEEKLTAWRTMPPDLLALLNGPPPPPPPMPPGMAPVGPDGMPLPPEPGMPMGEPPPPPEAAGPGAPPLGTSEAVLSPDGPPAQV